MATSDENSTKEKWDAEGWEKDATGPVEAHIQEAEGNGGLQEQLRRIARAIDRQGRKLEHLSDEQEALRERAGKMSARAVVTMTSIFLAALGTLIGTGMVFVQNADDHLDERIKAQEIATSKLIEAVQTIIDRNSNFIDGLNESRWTNGDHDGYHSREIVPVKDLARRNEIAIARIELQVKALSDKIERNHPLRHPPPEK